MILFLDESLQNNLYWNIFVLIIFMLISIMLILFILDYLDI